RPSVSILQADDGVWVWKDHGANEKGTNIDLFMKLYSLSYVQAVKALRRQNLRKQIFSFPVAETRSGYTAKKKKKPDWKILDEYDLNVKTLQLFKSYRGLKPKYVKNVGIKQLLLLLGDKKFSLCGHQNMSGTWELYNVQGGFKSSTGKDITYISRGKDTLVIAESLIDSISCEQIKEEFFDLLVLNSVEMINRAVDFLSDLKSYSKIVIATDNDKAGKKAANMLLPACKTRAERVVSFSYNQNKDPNDYLKGKK
ncbi:MAG: toprim domain-containing protein, partial [Deltaproteobacteria bacterium]|nr:toprim domain-containing protein [Deltaproteobacteria bacterium]